MVPVKNIQQLLFFDFFKLQSYSFYHPTSPNPKQNKTSPQKTFPLKGIQHSQIPTPKHFLCITMVLWKIKYPNSTKGQKNKMLISTTFLGSKSYGLGHRRFNNTLPWGKQFNCLFVVQLDSFLCMEGFDVQKKQCILKLMKILSLRKNESKDMKQIFS